MGWICVHQNFFVFVFFFFCFSSFSFLFITAGWWFDMGPSCLRCTGLVMDEYYKFIIDLFSCLAICMNVEWIGEWGWLWLDACLIHFIRPFDSFINVVVVVIHHASDRRGRKPRAHLPIIGFDRKKFDGKKTIWFDSWCKRYFIFFSFYQAADPLLV